MRRNGYGGLRISVSTTMRIMRRFNSESRVSTLVRNSSQRRKYRQANIKNLEKLLKMRIKNMMIQAVTFPIL